MKRNKDKNGRYIRKSYRITFGEPEYGDIIQLLDSTPKPLRGILIAESIRHTKKNIMPNPHGGHRESSPFSFQNNFDE